MISVIAFREKGWFETERHERRMWKQTLAAYGVKDSNFHLADNGEHFKEILKECSGTPVFMTPKDGQLLSDFKHPQDAIYILGNASENLNKYIGDSMQLTIETPNNTDMFGCVAIAPVLYSHYIKNDS